MTFRHDNIYLRNIKKEFQILIEGAPETKLTQPLMFVFRL
jgi:hypothetical protein